MDTIAYERWNDLEGVEGNSHSHDLLAREVRRHDGYSLPDDEALIFCPECGALAEDFDHIAHKDWCFYGEHRATCPGNF